MLPLLLKVATPKMSPLCSTRLLLLYRIIRQAALTIIICEATLKPSIAKPSEEIHKLCLQAKDYYGCVKSHEGKKESITTNIGIAEVGGNRCPNGYAYAGGGYCRAVRCEYNAAGFNPLGHDPMVAGKDRWKCKWNFWAGAGVLRLGDSVRVGNDPSCPEGEPEIGWNSTCGATGTVFAGKNE